MSTKYLKSPFIRVGVNYFKIIEKIDRAGTKQTELKPWNKQEIIQDLGKKYIKEIPKYDDFTMVPDNERYRSKIGNCYNMYSKFPHKQKQGEWMWTERLMQHIFAEQYDLGIKYIQCLYLYPKQALPVLAIVSEERATGKSTFIDWINIMFGNNAIIINPDEIGASFNSSYATKNIIAIEETLIEKSATVEKIKSISTQKFMSVNQKFVAGYKLPFYGKIMMASNNEDKFIKVDQKEIRFFVRKIGIPKFENHKILDDMTNEIPAFLDYLKSLPDPDFTKSRMVFTAEELKNGTLTKVKEQSKSGLYHEIVEHLTEYFNNEGSHKDFIEFTPKDIKEHFFARDQKITFNYLKRTFLHDFSIKNSPKSIRYTDLNGTKKVGKTYILKREDIIPDHKENGYKPDNEQDNDSSDVPF